MDLNAIISEYKQLHQANLKRKEDDKEKSDSRFNSHVRFQDSLEKECIEAGGHLKSLYQSYGIRLFPRCSCCNTPLEFFNSSPSWGSRIEYLSSLLGKWEKNYNADFNNMSPKQQAIAQKGIKEMQDYIDFLRQEKIKKCSTHPDDAREDELLTIISTSFYACEDVLGVVKRLEDKIALLSSPPPYQDPDAWRD